MPVSAHAQRSTINAARQPAACSPIGEAGRPLVGPCAGGHSCGNGARTSTGGKHGQHTPSSSSTRKASTSTNRRHLGNWSILSGPTSDSATASRRSVWAQLATVSFRLGQNTLWYPSLPQQATGDCTMTTKNKLPTSIDRRIIVSLDTAVPMGERRQYSDSSQLPPDVSWGGPDCQCVVIAASSYSGPNPPGVPSSRAPSPGGPVYLVRRFRSGSGGSPIHKVDDSLYYPNGNGAWSVHSKDSPDHHRQIMSGSGLNSIVRDFGLPSGSSGTIEEYRSAGGHLDFDEPFWKSQPK
jgi:hypothetical protein